MYFVSHLYNYRHHNRKLLVSIKLKISVIEITIIQTSTWIFALFVHYLSTRGFVFSESYFLKVHRRKSFDEEFVSPFNIHIKSCSGTFIILFHLYNLEIDNLNLRSRVCLTFWIETIQTKNIEQCVKCIHFLFLNCCWIKHNKLLITFILFNSEKSFMKYSNVL